MVILPLFVVECSLLESFCGGFVFFCGSFVSLVGYVIGCFLIDCPTKNNSQTVFKEDR